MAGHRITLELIRRRDEKVIGFLTKTRVYGITLGSESTQFFCLVNSMLGGILKREERYAFPFDNENTTI
jgi:hypothetical protein